MKLSDKRIVEENLHVTCRRCDRGCMGTGAREFVATHLETCPRYEQNPRGKRRIPAHGIEIELPKAAATDFEAWYAPPTPEAA
jgi:hypothetical protein